MKKKNGRRDCLFSCSSLNLQQETHDAQLLGLGDGSRDGRLGGERVRRKARHSGEREESRREKRERTRKKVSFSSSSSPPRSTFHSLKKRSSLFGMRLVASSSGLVAMATAEKKPEIASPPPSPPKLGRSVRVVSGGPCFSLFCSASLRFDGA